MLQIALSLMVAAALQMLNDEVLMDSVMAYGKVNFSNCHEKVYPWLHFVYSVMELLFSSHVKLSD